MSGSGSAAWAIAVLLAGLVASVLFVAVRDASLGALIVAGVVVVVAAAEAIRRR